MTTVLPRVYTVGFRAGQTVQQLLSTFLSFAAGGDKDESFALSNKLWWRIQEEAPEIWSMITSFPVWYKTWWMELLRNDPVHLFVETTLLLSVVYMFVTRTKDYSESKQDKLTTQEEDDLIHEWRNKTRAPLASPASDNSLAVAKDVPEFVVHKVQGTKMQVTMDKDPTKYDVVNFGTFDFLGFSAEFTAQNTIQDNDDSDENNNNNPADDSTDGQAEAAAAAATTAEGEEGLSKNAKKKKRKKKKTAAAKAAAVTTTVTTSTTTSSSIDTSNMNPIKKASVDALERYGCGACGPRGFYGTVDPHLKLEAEFTKFMGSDGAILYSDGASTVSSTIAAFCKRGDLLVVDEGVREPIIAGVKLSRAYVKWFKHNDMVRTALCVLLFGVVLSFVYRSFFFATRASITNIHHHPPSTPFNSTHFFPNQLKSKNKSNQINTIQYRTTCAVSWRALPPTTRK